MKIFNHTFLLRFAASIILVMHSIPGMLDGSVYSFGKFYLDDTIGLAPFGVALAWVIKLSHVAAAASLMTEKFLVWACGITILILVVGIVMVHWKEGWYVVGGGRNGIEFNFLLIFVLLTIAWSKRNT